MVKWVLPEFGLIQMGIFTFVLILTRVFGKYPLMALFRQLFKRVPLGVVQIQFMVIVMAITFISQMDFTVFGDIPSSLVMYRGMLEQYPSYGLRGDGGQATLAVLNTPVGLFLSSIGILYFVDQGNHRVRMIDTSTGIINTFAGSSDGFSGDNGLATAAKLSSPQSVWGNSMGVIFIIKSSNTSSSR